MTNIPLPQWKEKRKTNNLRVSATQFESMKLCERKWWFSRVRGLKEPSSKSMILGTILHGVIERWLRADKNGRDKDGNPVNIYPEGWHRAMNRFRPTEVEGEISPSQQDLVRRLVAEAIEEGILVRREPREMERSFERVMLTHEGVNVIVSGFIDLEHVGEIQDHKTTSSTKWIKSPNELRSAIPMNLYAYDHVEGLKEMGAPVPPKITLRHNAFVTDFAAPVVRKVEAEVTLAEINSVYDQMLAMARRMVELRSVVDDGLEEIRDPDNPAEACNAYGGCPFRTICSRKESVEQYEKRLDEHSKSGHNPNVKTNSESITEVIQPVSKEDHPVTSFASKIAAKGAAAAFALGGKAPAPALTAPPSPPPPPKPTAPPPPPPRPNSHPMTKLSAPSPAAAPAAPAAPSAAPSAAAGPWEPRIEVVGTNDAGDEVYRAPWAHDGCMACKGSGISTKGEPCVVCRAKAVKAGMTNAVQMHPQGDGTAIAQIGDDLTLLVAMNNFGVEVRAQERVAPPAVETVAKLVEAERRATAPARPAAPVAAPVAPAAPAAEAVAEETAEVDSEIDKLLNPTTGRGRPRKGYQLFVNCTIAKNTSPGSDDRKVRYLSEIMDAIRTQLAKEAGVESFFQIDTFKRRDMLRQVGPRLAESLGVSIIVCEMMSNAESDQKALFEGLRSEAGLVVYPADV